MKIAILIPCYNEEENIVEIFENLESYRKKSKHEIKFIFIDDGSTDQTSIKIKAENYDYLYHVPVNQGLGNATRVGLEIAHYIEADACIKFDADLQHQVNDFDPIIDIFENDKADIVYASRFKGKIHYKMPLYRYLGNKFFIFLMNMITNYKITDSQTGMMAFNKRFISVFEMPGTYNPPQQAIYDGYFKGLRYLETKADFFERKKGESFIGPLYVYHVFTNLIKIFYKHTFHKFYFFLSFISLVGLVILILNVIRNVITKKIIYLENETLFISLLIIFTISLFQGINLFSNVKEKNFFRRNKDYLYFDKDFLICKKK